MSDLMGTFLSVLFTLICGAVFFGVAGYLFRQRQRKILDCSVLTVATVCNILSYQSRNQHGHYRTYYKPVFSFVAHGYEHRVTYNIGDTRCRYRRGDVVSIYYNPSNPKDIRIDGEHDTIILVTSFSIAGFICLFFAVFILYLYIAF